MEFSRQEYWSELPFPSPGDPPNPGIKPMSLAFPALAGGFFMTGPLWKPSPLTVKLKFLSNNIENCFCSNVKREAPQVFEFHLIHIWKICLLAFCKGYVCVILNYQEDFNYTASDAQSISEQNAVSLTVILSVSSGRKKWKLRNFFPIEYLTLFYFLNFWSAHGLMSKNPIIFPQKSEDVTVEHQSMCTPLFWVISQRPELDLGEQ